MLSASPGALRLASPRKTVRNSLRIILADSQVAAAAIAVLLLWFFDGIFQAAWTLGSRVVSFLFTAIAILDIPYFSSTLTFADRSLLLLACSYLYSAIVSLSAAWLLSRWVYGVGPLRSLIRCQDKLIVRKHV
jgi:hypothetical protein